MPAHDDPDHVYQGAAIDPDWYDWARDSGLTPVPQAIRDLSDPMGKPYPAAHAMPVHGDAIPKAAPDALTYRPRGTEAKGPRWRYRIERDTNPFRMANTWRIRRMSRENYRAGMPWGKAQIISHRHPDTDAAMAWVYWFENPVIGEL